MGLGRVFEDWEEDLISLNGGHCINLSARRLGRMRMSNILTDRSGSWMQIRYLQPKGPPSSRHRQLFICFSSLSILCNIEFTVSTRFDCDESIKVVFDKYPNSFGT
jgi:hypothetical protein